jgi:membrane protein required for colicin V production
VFEILKELSAYDWIIVVITAVSVLMGVWRGMITELVSLGSWLGAWLLARFLSEPLAQKFFGSMENSALRLGLSFVLVFVVSLVLIRLLGRGLSRVAGGVGLKPLDRLLGAVFGGVRALVLLMVLTCGVALTGLNKEADWKRAGLTGPLERVTAWALPLLPGELAERIHLYPAESSKARSAH